MNWNFKTWKPSTRVLFVLIVFFIFMFLGIAKGHAEETVAGHIKEAVYETLVGGVALTGAIEAAATGNIGMGIALGAIAGREFSRAYEEARAAWDLYRSYEDPNRNDRDISPAESNMEHGRD